MKRRDFFKQFPILLSIPMGSSLVFSQERTTSQKYLILIELKGGNDGLNTLVPLKQLELYNKFRPSIAHSAKYLRKMKLKNEDYSLHPLMKNTLSLYNNNELALIAGVGMENSSLSHFGMIKNWERGSIKGGLPGWNTQLINRLEVLKRFQNNPGYVFGSVGLGPLLDSNTKVIKNFEDFKKLKLGQADVVASKYNESLSHIIRTRALAKNLETIGKPKLDLSKYSFPDSRFGEQIKTALKVLSSGEQSPFFKLSLSGFDTHVNQKERHDVLLKELDDGLKVLVEALKELKIYNNSVIMTYSEFGRNPKENGSLGTDHGTSNVQFLLGGAVKGGQVAGEYPDLSSLVDNKHLEVNVDFRSVYSEVSRNFFQGGVKLKRDNSFPEFLDSEFIRKDLKLF